MNVVATTPALMLHPPSPRSIHDGDGAPDDMLIALLLLLGLAILAYAYAFIRAAIAKRVGPSPEAIVARRDRQLSRYARHRLVRAHHCLVPVPAHGPRPADSADPARRPDPGGDGPEHHLPAPARRAGRSAAAVRVRDRGLHRRAGRRAAGRAGAGLDRPARRRDRPRPRRLGLCDDQPPHVPRRRDRLGPAADADHDRHRRQLRLRHSRQFRGRQLRARPW